VIDGPMRSEVPADFAERRRFVGHEVAFGRSKVFQRRAEIVGANVRHVDGSRGTIPLDQRENRVHVAAAARMGLLHRLAANDCPHRSWPRPLVVTMRPSSRRTYSSASHPKSCSKLGALTALGFGQTMFGLRVHGAKQQPPSRLVEVGEPFLAPFPQCPFILRFRPRRPR
jgi:hypothetical protein